jgi:transcription elongation GreA/GreB family factor
MIKPGADKQALIQAIVTELEREHGVMQRAAQTAREAATHEEMKPENDKDTRGIEAGYLAGAQAQRGREIERALTSLRAIPASALRPHHTVAIGALVAVVYVANRRRATVFLAPAGGGLKVDLDGTSVMVVTPESPLGESLLGCRAGDVAEIERGDAVELVEVARVE